MGRFVWWSVLSGGNSAVAELKDVLGGQQVLEPVRAQVSQIEAVDDVPRRLREQHLPAVPRGGDPCRTVDVHAHVALVGSNRLPGVDAHAHPHRPLG